MLNEDLYTMSSSDSFERFQQNPALFEEYHRGFREQAKTWASTEAQFGGKKKNKKNKPPNSNEGDAANTQNNPVEWIKARILSRYSSSAKNPKSPPVAVADFGCGDCTVHKSLPNPGFKVHSLDLVCPPPPHPLSGVIRACNIARMPFLPTESLDVGIYSLALMGTDVFGILKEGSRVLKVGGRLYISEVRSRFQDTKDKVS
jgi:ribosomal RNA-processing protein 8